MPQPAPTLASTLRFLRILHACFLVTMFLYIYVPERLVPRQHNDVHALWIPYLVLAMAVVGLAVYFRSRVLRSATDSLQAHPDDNAALGRMRTINIFSFVCMDSIVLFGFSLRFMGGSFLQSLPFYSIGIALMLLWWPRRP